MIQTSGGFIAERVALRRLVEEFPGSEWARRARQKQTSLAP